jgi:phenylacetyl-CoA:acceptor oxidoreductase subunit 2
MTVGLSALGFLICQARILYAGKGIPAWRAPLIPWLLVATGLLEGVGLFVLIHLLAPDRVAIAPGVFLLGSSLAVITGGLWIVYRASARRRGIPPLARRELDRVSPIVTILGHLLPLMGFAAAVGLEPNQMSNILIGLAAAGAVIGGIVWKFTVITRASHQQGFAFPKLPRRGSGNRAAPFRAGMA